jgi:predicted nucleic acid-binding protein
MKSMTANSFTTTITFIDTNVWLYAFQKTQDPAKTRRAKEVIRTQTPIAVSTQVINEVSYNLIRKFSFDEAQVRRLIRLFALRPTGRAARQAGPGACEVLRDNTLCGFARAPANPA